MSEPTALPVWPTTEPDTATLIAYYVGHGLAAVNRFYATQPPDRDDRDAVKQWMDDVPTLAHCYAVAACLMRLDEVDHDAADETARMVWWMTEAGEQGEPLHDWAVGLGLDVAGIRSAARAEVVRRGCRLMFPDEASS